MKGSNPTVSNLPQSSRLGLCHVSSQLTACLVLTFGLQASITNAHDLVSDHLSFTFLEILIDHEKG